MLSLIVAASENNAIGKNNELLWCLPTDMRYFKNTTWGLPVIMGRKTFEALGKPLTGRYNVVITTNPEFHPDGIETVSNLKDAIQAAGVMKTNEIMIIGGGTIYKESLPMADRVYLTRVHALLEGDTFFPELDAAQWQLTTRHDVSKDEKNDFDMSFEIWDRKVNGE